MTSNEWSARLRELGIRIGEGWRARGRDEAAFPEVTERILSDSALRASSGDDFAALALSLLAADPLPPQLNPEESFGQPPVTAYRGEGFVVDVLFWIDGLVAVHQHAFSGAFSVFAGSSIHCRYTFAERKRVNAAMRLGELQLADAELLEAGDVRTIHAGSPLIHSTFHLDRPTISIVARTEAESDSGPQYDYRRPALAIDPFYARPTTKKRLQILKMLRRTRPESYWQAVESVLAGSDGYSAYLVLEQGYQLSSDAEERERLVALARAVHGSALDVLVPVLEQSAQRRSLLARRDATTDDELRFFFALLLTVPSRAAIRELVAKRFASEDADAVVLRCLEKDGFDEPTRALAAALMSGASSREAWRQELARANVRVRNDYELLSCVRVLRSAPCYGALFAPSA